MQGQIFKNLIVKTTQQSLNRIAYGKALELQKFFVEMVPSGYRTQTYQDFYQGSSELNTDTTAFKTASKQSTTPKTGFEDTQISDFAQNGVFDYEEYTYADKNFSIDFTIYSALLNDIYFDIAMYLAVAAEVEFKLNNALNLYNKQRLINFYSNTDQYCSSIILDPLKATPSATDKETYYLSIISAILKEGVKLTTTDGRSVLGEIKPDKSEVALFYTGGTKKRFIFVNADKWVEAKLNINAKLFNEKYAQVSDYFEVIPVNFTNWGELNPLFKTNMEKIFLSSDINFIVADENWYQEIQQYNGSEVLNTGKLYTKAFTYLKRGSYRLKTEYASICGDKKASSK